MPILDMSFVAQEPNKFRDTDELLAMRLEPATRKPKQGKRRRRGSKVSVGTANPNGAGSRRPFNERKPRGVGGPQNAPGTKEMIDKMRRQFDLEAKRKVKAKQPLPQRTLSLTLIITNHLPD